MRNAPDSATLAPTALGFSVGRWEGTTLVVETSRVSWPYLDGDGTPQTENVRMIERFAPSEADARLDYALTVIEPASLEEPAVWVAYWLWDPSITLTPYECRLDSSHSGD